MAPRQLTIIHFNDVYNIEASSNEPVGGAARLVHKVTSWSNSLGRSLVLFSGDAFNPSLMSTMTLGKQMVPVLKAAGVDAACVGNHDFDFGIKNFRDLAAECGFPWLMANVLDAETDEPLGGVGRTLLLQHPSGIKVGIIGLVEGDWVETLSCVEPEEVHYLDFVEEGRRLAQELRSSGAELVLALTHMRVPNDIQLAQAVPEIDVVLGGHDHHVQIEVVQPHNNLLCKSGTDFKNVTAITVTCRKQQQRQRQQMAWQDYPLTSDVPEDPEMAQVVEEFASAMGAGLDAELGHTLTDLDGRFATVRTSESNLCNLLTDVFRRACSADVCILNSGTFRSDAVHPAGTLTHRDLACILPMIDDTVVLRATGQQLLEALENGVSMYPKLEGRFPQVSGIRFAFDPSKPPGHRILPESVTTGSERAPLDASKTYALATKAYLAEGKDGYDMLHGCPVLMDAEVSPCMQTVLRNFFNMLEVLNLLDPKIKVATFAKRWAQALKHKGRDRQTDLITTGGCIKCPQTGRYAVAPKVDGRITCVGRQQQKQEARKQQQQQEGATCAVLAGDEPAAKK
ncbi:Metallo-dependent phosphatase-like protein [Scenedesmus sp. NREL 46B-D3]|nr:Metallo-dependent phosphatase-like protein [Scenedesmus sp. NREL 46B-D3]